MAARVTVPKCLAARRPALMVFPASSVIVKLDPSDAAQSTIDKRASERGHGDDHRVACLLPPIKLGCPVEVSCDVAIAGSVGGRHNFRKRFNPQLAHTDHRHSTGDAQSSAS